MLSLLKEYTDAFGVTGSEKYIRETIKGKIEGLGVNYTDSMGNLIVHRSGKGKRVMLAAHMDEVGFIAVRIRPDGGIKFATVGGIDGRILLSKRVYFKRSGIRGVIGCKPIHLQSISERNKPIAEDELFIDIGAKDAEEAGKYIKPGDYAVFESEYVDMGRFVKAKALDDRVGCAVITELLKENYSHDLYAAFTVQEEAGLRGARTAAYAVKPEIALVFEGTTCADFVKDEKDFVTECGKGPVLSVMDRASIGDSRLLRKIIKAAEDNNIPYQMRRGNVGGNDAGSIHKAAEGCITAAISVPTRYIHSPVSMMCKEDFENVLRLAKAVLSCLEGEEL